MRYIFTSLFLLLLYGTCTAQEGISKRIILLGNAREAIKENNHFLDAVKESIVFDSNTIVLYLGNNTLAPYDTIALRQEADIISNSPAKAFFIPGYADWANGGEHGDEALLHQQQFLESLKNKNIKVYPHDACPGPKKVELGNDAVMLIMDSQWWLHEHTKPDIESDCKYRTKEEVLAEIEDFPKDNFDKLVLFVSHHPLENTSVHSGTFGLKQHIFPFTDLRKLGWLYLPLPVIGSVYPIVRNAIPAKQDMNSLSYKTFAETGIGTLPGIKEAFKDHPYSIFISGQEHNLQLISKDHHHYIVSGASGKAGRVRNGKHVAYVKRQTGFAVLEITNSKKVSARFYTVSDHIAKESHIEELADYSKLPPLAKDTAMLNMVEADSTVAIAARSIAYAKGLKRLLVGENYRKEWGVGVAMKVLHVDIEKGGLKVKGMGGGHESTSLQFEGSDGKKWVLRSMNKNLAAVIPEGFQETIASEYIHDMLSGSNPYGALVVPDLEKALGIVHASPTVYFVPNDTALGVFRPLVANTVCLLEERKPALNENPLVKSNEALNTMVQESDHLLDQEMYLKIRLVDFLIADFDRHHGQYTWGTIDTANRKMYYPIPKDRDQALYNNRGLIIAIARQGGAYKFMMNFPYKIDKIKNCGIVGAYMDMLLLNNLTEQDWRRTINEFRTTLSDSVIGNAVRKMPPEIYAIRGPEVNARLISRRNNIADKGLDYYRFISKKVNVLGGNKDETFRVSGNDSGLLVQIYTKGGKSGNELKYERNFDPAVTREIRLYGFNGNDYFDIDETAKSRIRLRIVGGKGTDTFDVKGRIRNHIYDLSFEDNEILSRSRTIKMFSRRPSVNEFKFRENIHNAFGLPIVTVGFNAEDGGFAGIGLSYKSYGFRKMPYASSQELSASSAFSHKAYQLRYKGEFNNIYRQYDLLVHSELFNPVLRNFYGYGNDNVRDPSKPTEYFRTKYKYASLDVLLRKRFTNNRIVSIAAGPSVFHYWIETKQNESRILEHPALVGLDPEAVYSVKSYAGGKASFTINNLNNELLPVRGVNWTTEFTALKALTESTEPYSRVFSSLDVYAVLNEPNQLLASLHFGGGHIFSSHYEYFQAMTIGGNNYLRGYRINRFAGSSMAYASAELKLKLFDFNAYIVKGDFGVVGFNDIGRVWVRNDHSEKWHHGYGGGIYLIPFNTLMLSVLAGFSEEDNLVNLTLGTRLNMVFQGL